jgi:hypothetical protein
VLVLEDRRLRQKMEEGSAKQPIAASQPVTISNPLQPVKPPPGGDDEDVVVDIEGDTDDTERASKRRRVDDHTETEAARTRLLRLRRSCPGKAPHRWLHWLELPSLLEILFRPRHSA